LHPTVQQVVVYMRVVDHFTEQENTFIRVFIHCSEGDFDSIFHAIAKAEMAGQVKLNGTKIQMCRGKILLTKIFDPAGFLYLTGNRRPVICRDIKLFDGK